MVVSDGVPTRYFSIKEQNFIKSLYIEKIEMATEVLPKKDSNKTVSINKVEDYLETILKEVSELKEIVKRQSEEIADLKNNDILKIESQEVKRSFWERFRGNKK